MEQDSGADEAEAGGSGSDGSPDGVIGEIRSEEDDVSSEESGPAPPTRPRRRSRMLGCLLALLGALAGGGLALWISRGAVVEQPPASSPDVATEAADELPANRLVFSPTPQRPEATPDIITAETEMIYCFYDMGRLPPDAELSATWSRAGEPPGDLPLQSHQRDPEADHARGRFVIRPPDSQAEATEPASARGFPSGIYEVTLTSPDHPDISAVASFVARRRAAAVLKGAGEPEGPPIIASLETASGVTEDGDAVGPSSEFAADTERITAVFKYRGVAPGSVLTVRWHAGKRELVRARTEIAATAAEGWAEAWVEVGDEAGFPEGDYRVGVHLGEESDPLATARFTIRSSSPEARQSPSSEKPAE
ncbi:MAG: hypothetical protein GF393_06965 [Armatimonadia bacterium]|nr:hypothetical protein [Armatimonadia bacterium]